ncbi:MAG TPA: pilus assembly protein [Novosphingobium sp.]|nr:pilus assembly protein [Novosphingobium sp.]
MKRLWHILSRLRRETAGLAMTEMALALPFLLGAGLWGVELANYGVANMRISQLAIHLADNASRIGDTSTLEQRKIYEADINDLMYGAGVQGGDRLGLFDNGRVIVSSLEVDEDERQFIHWQRCMGKKTWASSYGDAGDELGDGMGPADEKVIAFDDEAVMFVEVAYNYQPLISARFVGTPTIKAIASFTVRSSRDLSQVYQRDPGSPDDVADCGTFENRFGSGKLPSGTA